MQPPDSTQFRVLSGGRKENRMLNALKYSAVAFVASLGLGLTLLAFAVVVGGLFGAVVGAFVRAAYVVGGF